jgi:hypothetical protein
MTVAGSSDAGYSTSEDSPLDDSARTRARRRSASRFQSLGPPQRRLGFATEDSETLWLSHLSASLLGEQ